VTRMIERWFPSAEVSANSDKGWGSGNAEISLFMWFAKRPTVQAKAAMICSLLPWPDDESEQARLQTLVRAALTGRYAEWRALQSEIIALHPDGPTTLDPFSGRGMIPLEAARLGISAEAIDYSPMAVLASHLLTEAPFVDWSKEPALPFAKQQDQFATAHTDRLLRDLETLFDEIQRRHAETMRDFYPQPTGAATWGYLWAVSVPCQECGNRFPLVGSFDLILPLSGRSAISFYIAADRATGEWNAIVEPGPPSHQPSLTNTVINGRKIAGKSAVCVFCGHVHPLAVHRRLLQERLGRDELVLVADLSGTGEKIFRAPTVADREAVVLASKALQEEPVFTPCSPLFRTKASLLATTTSLARASTEPPHMATSWSIVNRCPTSASRAQSQMSQTNCAALA
jgi:putative DNA methylase